MVRLHLFAEGETEQTFADTVLKPHLANLGVYMQKPTLIAHARKKGIVHRGGGRNFRAMQNDIDRRRKQESGNDVFFTTMIDLYALSVKFPGVEEAEKLRLGPYKRVEALERSWFNETDDHRFIPFIQLHEFEAYLFSDVSQFAFFFDNADGLWCMNWRFFRMGRLNKDRLLSRLGMTFLRKNLCLLFQGTCFGQPIVLPPFRQAPSPISPSLSSRVSGA